MHAFFFPTCLVIPFTITFATGLCLLMNLNKDVNQLKKQTRGKNVVGNCAAEEALI